MIGDIFIYGFIAGGFCTIVLFIIELKGYWIIRKNKDNYKRLKKVRYKVRIK